MSSMYNFVLLLCTASLLTHCASANEKRALQRWENEESQWEAASAVAPALGPDTGLDIYVRFALRNNRGLRSAFERWRAALEEIAPARTLADPRFTYGYFIDEVETRVGAQKQRFSLVQTFPWIGKLDLAGRAALQAAEVEQQRYEAAKLDLVYRVQEAYCEYYYLQKAVEITRENIQLMIFLEGVVRVKYKGGRGQHQALIKTQVELGKLEDRLGTLRDMMRPFAARLNAALSRPIHAPLASPTILPDGGIDQADEQLIAALRQYNPELKAMEHLAAGQELAVQLARRKVYPDVTVGVDYITTGESRAALPPPDSGKDPIVAMLSVNLPIWRDKYSAAERQAQARQRAVLRDREERENQLVADVEMALYGLRDAKRRIALYRDNLLPKAEQALKVSQQAFAAGESDFLDLIDAQRALLEFQLAHERARTDRVLRLAKIDKLSGRRPIAAPVD